MKNIVLILVLFIGLIIAGCGGTAEVKETDNETKDEPVPDKTEEVMKEKTEETGETKEQMMEETTGSFFPWNDGFKDLETFSMSVYFVKVDAIDKMQKGIENSTEKAIENKTGIVKIWFKSDGGLLRIDHYNENWYGKGLCQGSPTEFLDYDGKKYALTIREMYKENTKTRWAHSFIKQIITQGGNEAWDCKMKLEKQTVQTKLKNAGETIEAAFGLAAYKYAKPSVYTTNADYENEIEQTKQTYEQYQQNNGARYALESNSLKARETIAGRNSAKFYITKPFGYGYELRDLELGNGLAFYLESLISDKGKTITLEKPFLLYTVLDFSKEANDNDFKVEN